MTAPGVVAPAIVCPSWCTVPQAEHVADLSNWDGLVIHWSSTRRCGDLSATLGLSALPDGTPDPNDPLKLHAHIAGDGTTLDEAERCARMILALVAEARSETAEQPEEVASLLAVADPLSMAVVDLEGAGS